MRNINPIPLLWLNCWVSAILAPAFILLCKILTLRIIFEFYFFFIKCCSKLWKNKSQLIWDMAAWPTIGECYFNNTRPTKIGLKKEKVFHEILKILKKTTLAAKNISSYMFQYSMVKIILIFNTIHLNWIWGCWGK